MISFIYIDTEDLVLELDKASESKDSALEWVERMRDTLIFGGRRKDPLPFGLHCITVSKGYVANGKIGRWKRNAISELKKRDIDSPDNDEIIAEMYASHGAEYEEALEDIKAANEAKKRGFTAAATTREGVGVVPDRESGSLGCATTGCNNSQVAPTRKAGDELSNARKGDALKIATACNQLTADGYIREDYLNLHDTGDRGYMESGTSANHYDQEAIDKPTISANSPEGAGVNLDSTHTISPDASSGNAEGVNSHGSPIFLNCSGNGSRAACTFATSGQTISATEALEQPGAGEVPPESASAKPSPALPVLSFGEFGNIKMTNMQYAKLCERFGFADTVIEEADQYFEAQPAKKKKYKNHYAMLLNWCKRRETEAKPQQRYKNINDINQENYEKAMREIEAMCAGEAL